MNGPGLDYARLEEAKKVVEEGNQYVWSQCECCQGHSLPGMSKGEPGYCPNCKGSQYVRKFACDHYWDLRKTVDYWQARALIAEAKLLGKVI